LEALAARVSRLESCLAAVVQAPRARGNRSAGQQVYPREVRERAVLMQDAGASNLEIIAAIEAATGRRPDPKRITAQLRAWRKTVVTVV
jgi:hypothetical protein